MLKNKLVLITTIICVLITLTSCGIKNKEPLPEGLIILSETQEKNIELETAVAKEQAIDLDITVPGEFRAITDNTSSVYAPVDGKIADVFVTQGQSVAAGQNLISLQSDYIGQIQSELMQNIIETDANIRIANSQLSFAKNNFARESELLKEKITSKRDWEDAKTQYEKETANLSALIAKKASMISMYKQRLNLYGADTSVVDMVISTHKISPYITLKANKSGIILSRKVNSEEFVSANKELFELSDLSKIWLSGFIYADNVQSVKLGNVVSAEIDDGNVVKGKLIYIAPSIDENTKTLEVRAEIDNAKGMLKPNLYAKMTITVGKMEALIIPVAAVQKFGDANLIYVEINPHVYEERNVELGQKTAEYAEIKSGIKAGETVVTKGSFALLGESIKQNEAK